jgi:DnaK suppressor protein
MDSTAAKPYLYQLTRQRNQLLAQVAEQRGGQLGRAEVANAHFDNGQDDQAQILSEPLNLRSMSTNWSSCKPSKML